MGTALPRDKSDFSVAVRDPVWKHVWLTPALRDITLTAPFLRLYRIRQLGPTECAYPGATHTRASHSIGVYHLARRILDALRSRGADKWVTESGTMSFLAAALLHDLGHFPFTHSLKELPLEDHEILTARLILKEPLASAVRASGADPFMVASIIDKTGTVAPGMAADKETVFYRHLLSGVLDPDKLDYLNRDAYYCGVPYGLQDTDFILSRIMPDIDHGIVIDSRAIMSIESVLFSKYLMYRSVYWHRQVRIATAMMKKAIFAALQNGLIQSERLYEQDDEGIYGLVGSLDYPERALAIGVRERAFYRVLCEIPFRQDNPEHARLENLAIRSEAEKDIARFLAEETSLPVAFVDVIIDIPERISFESDLFVVDEGKHFTESSTVFSAGTVARFTESLRMLRVAVAPRIGKAAEGIPDIAAKLAKCLHLG
ncbi:MAG TPA: HD domain-containing protein [Treponemataceae bacterium]|nr:HD domain-containing protein [Treponemataceae bacterium]